MYSYNKTLKKSFVIIVIFICLLLKYEEKYTNRIVEVSFINYTRKLTFWTFLKFKSILLVPESGDSSVTKKINILNILSS